MSFIGGLFDGSKGANFSAQMPNLLQTANPLQLAQSYDQSYGGLQQQQAFLQALQGQNGIGNQASVFGQQQQLADQLGQQAQGQGPNPALNQLAQTTGQNIAGQNALMAGQRGASANVGLLARQAASQGAGIQQNAVGQAAIMRANQQLMAQQLLQQQQQQMAGVAGQQVAQQGNALGAYNQYAQNNQGQILGAGSNYNAAQVGATNSANAANAGIAKGNQDFQTGVVKGTGDILGKVAGLAFPGSAGKVLGVAHGGQIQDDGSATGPASNVGKFLCEAFGGKVMNAGGKVPGQAAVKGDSYKNDKIPAKLSPGEIVIPRTIAQGENAPEKAAAFVRAILAKNGGHK